MPATEYLCHIVGHEWTTKVDHLTIAKRSVCRLRLMYYGRTTGYYLVYNSMCHVKERPISELPEELQDLTPINELYFPPSTQSAPKRPKTDLRAS